VLDMRVNRAVERLHLLAADDVEQLAAGEDATRLAHQRSQQVEFSGSELDGSCADPGLHPRHVERDIRGTNDIAAPWSDIRAAEHRPDPRDELARAERLGDVIVGAELEPDQLVALVNA